MDRPNILWICTDQQRYDTVGGLNNPHIRTPNLDRLMAEGVAFTHAFAQSPVCTPSRAAFLTGRYPRTTRARQNGQNIPDDELLVTKLLADAGYDCGLSGKLHIAAAQGRVERRIADGYRVFHWSHHPAPDWRENAYIRWLEAKGYSWEDVYPAPKRRRHAFAGAPAELHQTTWCAEKAIEFMAERRDGPWLFSLNCFDPHHPFDPPKEFLDRYDPDAVPDPMYQPGELDAKPVFQRIDHEGAYGGRGMAYGKLSPSERREVVAAYYAMCTLIDDQVGRLLDALDASGQRHNTLVLFTSDHGEMLGDHGIFLKGPYFYDCAVRVPLILSWPARFPKGLVSDALVELVDLVPTLLDAVGLPVAPGVQARSLFPLCAGEADPHRHRDAVYAEYYNAMPFHNWHAPRPYATMVRTRAHKLVAFHGLDQGELYDLEPDPHEVHNLWAEPAHKDLKLDLLKRLADLCAITADPLPERIAEW